jgi:acyl phosphate:glycerol-3-phosphate acyltransferase
MSGYWIAAIAIASYLLGSTPFSNIVAHFYAGIDLRQVGTGTVTPRNLYETAGLLPALLAGLFEVAKGVVGPLLVVHQNLLVIAAVGALAVAGHNWSIFLRGAGGRGVSTATGVLFVMAWPGALVMCAGLLAGILTKQVGRAMSAAFCALLPVLALTEGVTAVYGALIVIAPIAVKTGVLVRKRGAPSWRRPGGS